MQKTVFKPARRVLLTVCRDYYRSFRLHAVPVDVAGHPLLPGRTKKKKQKKHTNNEALACCLQEALCWGEPYIFFRMSGVVSWIVGLVDRRELVGGIVGGEVLAYDGADKEALRLYGGAAGCRPSLCCPAGHGHRRFAGPALSAAFYQISGWRLLDGRRKATAASGAEAMVRSASKREPQRTRWTRAVVAVLIKAGDLMAQVLNETLSVMFLFSPKLVILRARAIEMMGYLTRAAVEDNVEMEPLLEQNHQWMRKLIAARDFETLAHVLMQALDAFMDGIYSHSRGIGHPGLLRVLEYINQNFQRNLTLQEAAQAAGLSAFHVSRLLKRHTGRTFLQHLTQRRVRQAMQYWCRRNSRKSLMPRDFATKVILLSSLNVWLG